MASSPWQDRRGMFQSGKAVHEPSLAARRRSSASASDSSDPNSKAAKPGGLASLAALAGLDHGPEGSTKTIYRRGREVHEPAGAGRKKSVGADGVAEAAVAAAGGAGAGAGAGAGVVARGEAGVAGRRRSSASSQSGSAFSAVLSNPDYAQRRQSWDDMKAPGGFGGLFGGLMGRPAEKK